MTSLPKTRVLDPRLAPTLRWGVLAPGGIAAAFVGALLKYTSQNVVACGSRSLERAQQFADRFGIERAYSSYEELVADPEVDAIYVASVHSRHAEHALLAIAAGKHVLVEKAFTQTSAQAEQVVAAARAADVTVMEAMWTRFLPHMDVVRQALDDGLLGEIETVVADHGQAFPEDPTHRLFDPDAAGGAMLDLGVYPVSFAHFVLGTPGRVVSRVTRAFTGVDRQVSALLDQYPNPNSHALVTTTLASGTPTTATISGTKARIDIPGPFYAPQPVRLTTLDGYVAESPAPKIMGHDGLCFEAAHFASLVADGRRESPWLPLDETVAIIRLMEEMLG